MPNGPPIVFGSCPTFVQALTFMRSLAVTDTEIPAENAQNYKLLLNLEFTNDLHPLIILTSASFSFVELVLSKVTYLAGMGEAHSMAAFVAVVSADFPQRELISRVLAFPFTDDPPARASTVNRSLPPKVKVTPATSCVKKS